MKVQMKKQFSKKKIWSILGLLSFLLLVTQGVPVHAAPVLLESEMAVVYESPDDGSNAVGNLIRGNAFEILERTQTENGTFWYRIAVSNGVSGYIKGNALTKEAGKDSAVENGAEAGPGNASENGAANEMEAQAAGTGDGTDAEQNDATGADNREQESSANGDAREPDDAENTDAANTDGVNTDAENVDAENTDTENADTVNDEANGDINAADAGGISEYGAKALPKTYAVSNDSQRLLTGGREAAEKVQDRQSGQAADTVMQSHWWYRMDLAAVAAVAVMLVSLLCLKFGCKKFYSVLSGKDELIRKSWTEKRKAKKRKKAKALKKKQAAKENARELAKEEKKWKNSNLQKK